MKMWIKMSIEKKRQSMKKVISASRRSDLISFFPDWLASAVGKERVFVYGPSRHTYSVDLRPGEVHTFVLWSKNFSNLINDRFRLRRFLEKYDQIYVHFTITGLGGTPIEKGVPPPGKAIAQLDPLIRIAGTPERISLRFDPILYWKDGDKKRTNLRFFDELAPVLEQKGIKSVRFSFAQ